MSGQRKRVEEMSVEDLLRAWPGSRARVDTDGSIVIDEGPPSPLPRPVAARKATEDLMARTTRRIRRTAELKAEGRTLREIGELIGSEEGESEPFPYETVRSWWRRARRAKPSR